MRARAHLAAALYLALGAATGAESVPGAAQKGTAMAKHAGGTFEVKVQPLPKDEKVAGLAVGRLGFDKTWKGDFEGTSKGEMMTAETSVEGSAGYVAVERVSGKLKGRSGTFLALHRGTMKGGAFELEVLVVPDSGTGELQGLQGRITIAIDAGKHSYDIDYSLPDAP